MPMHFDPGNYSVEVYLLDLEGQPFNNHLAVDRVSFTVREPVAVPHSKGRSLMASHSAAGGVVAGEGSSLQVLTPSFSEIF